MDAAASADGTPAPTLPAPIIGSPERDDVPELAGGGDLGPDDGYVPVGETVTLDDDVPAITNLDPDILDALTRAAQDEAAPSHVGGGLALAGYAVAFVVAGLIMVRRRDVSA